MPEITSENLTELENRHRTTAIVFVVQISLTIILIVASIFIAPKVESPNSDETLRTLWFIIIFIALGTFLLRRMFLRWDRLRDISLVKGIKGLLRTLQSNAIILAVLAETVVIVGFVISFLSGDWLDTLRAGVVALILLAINFPRKSVWERIVTNLQEI